MCTGLNLDSGRGSARLNFENLFGKEHCPAYSHRGSSFCLKTRKSDAFRAPDCSATGNCKSVFRTEQIEANGERSMQTRLSNQTLDRPSVSERAPELVSRYQSVINGTKTAFVKSSVLLLAPTFLAIVLTRHVQAS